MKSKRNKLATQIVPAIVAIVFLFLYNNYVDTGKNSQKSNNSVIEQLFKSRKSGQDVTISAEVIKTLLDDNDGSRHQRFIVKSGIHSVLIAHNIDIASRVPVGTGDFLEIKGVYEWNEKGGVIHWTHRDLNQKRPGGWIIYNNKKYH